MIRLSDQLQSATAPRLCPKGRWLTSRETERENRTGPLRRLLANPRLGRQVDEELLALISPAHNENVGFYRAFSFDVVPKPAALTDGDGVIKPSVLRGRLLWPLSILSRASAV